MKLITELVEEVEFIAEGSGASKVYTIKGPFLVGDVGNKNKRFYPMPVLEKEVLRYTNEYIKENRAFGELGHPSGPVINLDRSSHIIRSLTKEGNSYVGVAKIIDTPMGKIVKTLLDEGAKLGVSSRGLGTLKMNRDGLNEVQSDFFLATAGDIVADPSAPGAFVQGIMENKEWLFVNGSWTCQDQDEAFEQVRAARRNQLEEVGIRLFENYLRKIGGSKK